MPHIEYHAENGPGDNLITICEELFIYPRTEEKAYFISKHFHDKMRKVYCEQRNRA